MPASNVPAVVRACREEQANVIGYAFRGADSKIVFDQDRWAHPPVLPVVNVCRLVRPIALA
jgi:hypothetical protein